jgi:hypothetical protein
LEVDGPNLQCLRAELLIEFQLPWTATGEPDSRELLEGIDKMKKVIPLLAVAATAVVLGCGGGGSDESQLSQLQTQAAAKETEARSLVVDSPCSTDSQCGALVFGFTTHVCGAKPQVAYLLAASTSAQAASAAEQQRSLASQAQALLPSDGTACTANTVPQPPISCLASRCVSGS